MGKNATRNDVAKLAGVSPAVVSYVINKTKFVSEEKTQAVLDAIKELNYQPNLYARSLKTNCATTGWRLPRKSWTSWDTMFPTATAVTATILSNR